MCSSSSSRDSRPSPKTDSDSDEDNVLPARGDNGRVRGRGRGLVRALGRGLGPSLPPGGLGHGHGLAYHRRTTGFVIWPGYGQELTTTVDLPHSPHEGERGRGRGHLEYQHGGGCSERGHPDVANKENDEENDVEIASSSRPAASSSTDSQTSANIDNTKDAKGAKSTP